MGGFPSSFRSPLALMLAALPPVATSRPFGFRVRLLAGTIFDKVHDARTLMAARSREMEKSRTASKRDSFLGD